MIFDQFCKQIASNELLTDPIVCSEDDADDILKERAQALCGIMRLKMNKLDRIEIPFIEENLKDLNRVEQLLSEYNQGEIPDYLLMTFSEKLYGIPFNELNIDQQSVIKTLSIYICVSIQSSNK